MSTNGIPTYIEVIEGAYINCRGYIKRKTPKGKYTCMIYIDKRAYERNFDRSQFRKINMD